MHIMHQLGNTNLIAERETRLYFFSMHRKFQGMRAQRVVHYSLNIERPGLTRMAKASSVNVSSGTIEVFGSACM